MPFRPHEWMASLNADGKREFKRNLNHQHTHERVEDSTVDVRSISLAADGSCQHTWTQSHGAPTALRRDKERYTLILSIRGIDSNISLLPNLSSTISILVIMKPSKQETLR